MYVILIEMIVCVVKKTMSVFTTLLFVVKGDECVLEHDTAKQKLREENIYFSPLFSVG